MDRPNVSRADIEKCLQITTESRGALDNLERLQGQLVAFASLCKVQFDRLRGDGIRMDFEHDMNALLKAAAGSNFSGIIGSSIGSGEVKTGGHISVVGSGIGTHGHVHGGLISGALEASIVNGVVHLTEYKDRVVEVPVQEARTKHLIHMLAVQMRKFFEKYPKLKDECDSRLYEFFQQELIDIIEVDELDRVVEIVKYVPDVVKVENVYAYSS